MSDISLNISGKIEPGAVALYQAVGNLANDHAIPFVVVGASARDIVLHYGHGAKIQRATADIDFGIQVPSWAAFEALKQALLDVGFRPDRESHRLISPDDIPIDIVPFGQLQDEEATIAWPPGGDVVMNVLGFQETCDSAEMVRIQDEPPVDIPVATPAGMVVLKLIAWMDREPVLRGKDAHDLRFLLESYAAIPAVSDELYTEQVLMERYDWDLTLASAHCLGIHARAICSAATQTTIACLLNNAHQRLGLDRLLEEMSENNERDYARCELLANAFAAGFLAANEPGTEI